MRLPANDWAPRDYQMPAWKFLNSGGMRACLVWPRRHGKDEVALNWTAHSAFKRVGNYWHMLPKASQIRRSIWTAVDATRKKKRIDLAFPRELRSATRNNDMFIEFQNGSTWQAVGSDNFDHLVGASPVGIVFSEWALADPRAWGILRPILLENDGWAIFIYTPRGKNHGFKTLQTARASKHWFHQVLKASKLNLFSEASLARELDEYQKEYGMEQGQALYDQEYECSFEAPILGAFYAQQLRRLEAEGRLTNIPIDRGVRVHTAWDLGRTDSTAIWFIQCVGRERRCVDYYESSGAGIDHYVDILWQKKHEHKWIYGEHYFPPDVDIHPLDNSRLSRMETFRSLGVEVTKAQNAHWNQLDGINAVRRMLDRTWIDIVRCDRGLETLRNYHREWDGKLKDWKQNPMHDWSSHGATALEVFAVGYDDPTFISRARERRARAGDPGTTHWSS